MVIKRSKISVFWHPTCKGLILSHTAATVPTLLPHHHHHHPLVIVMDSSLWQQVIMFSTSGESPVPLDHVLFLASLAFASFIPRLPEVHRECSYFSLWSTVLIKNLSWTAVLDFHLQAIFKAEGSYEGFAVDKSIIPPCSSESVLLVIKTLIIY